MAKSINADAIIEQLTKQLADLQVTPATVSNIGTIIQVGDGVVEIRGLSKAMYGEILDFGHNIYGLVLNLLKDSVGAIIMGDYTRLEPGDTVKSTGRIFEVPVSAENIGRVVNPLGEPVDGKGPISLDKHYPVEKIAPGIITRKPVSVPVLTGVKAIDALTPIGRGQRQLIIGDRGTGKSSIAITTIMNQKDQDMICVYVAIGQKKSYIAQLVDIFDKSGAFDYTVVVAASASDPMTFQYLAPYVGTAIGEYFMDQGKDVLVIYDDLSKHAWAYREVSLLLRRPAGREAYRGDVFYLHSRLLERACRLNEENGGGSLTALPIIETQAGDVSAYIPTNVISITDGQIYLEPDLFNAGIRPAINSGLSVSRVGSAAQTPKMKQVAGRMKLELAQYRELQAFSQFASDLDAKTKAQLDRGAKVTEILKQNWETPYPILDEVLIMWAVNNNYLDNVSVENIKTWETKYLDYLKHKGKKIYQDIAESEGKFTDKQTEQLTKFTEEFNQTIGKSLLQPKTEGAQP